MRVELPLTKPRRLFRFEMGVTVHPHRQLIAVHPFYHSSFGAFLRRHFATGFTRPSQHSFLLLALGLVFAGTRHTVSSYLWRAGAVSTKHFTRFYVFLGAPCYRHLDQLFARVIVLAAGHVPADEPLHVRFDETTCKKTGRMIEGAARYRNGAGTARQEFRTLFAGPGTGPLNFVLGELRIRLAPWPEHLVSVPIGLQLYLKPDEARRLGRPYRSRSQLARTMLDTVCGLVGPARRVVSVQDGDYATKAFLRGLPPKADVVGRLPIGLSRSPASPLYALPTPRRPGQRGRPALKGRRLGNAKELAAQAKAGAWQAHPEEAGAEILVVDGLWHSVVPGVRLRVVVVRRPPEQVSRLKKSIEAFFTTLTELKAAAILAAYRARWSFRLCLSREILIREAREHYGLGQDRCRRYDRIVGLNGLRLVVGAAQVLWVADEVRTHAVALAPYQPWYRQKQVVSLHDIAWAVRERLLAEGIIPTVGFWGGMGIIHELHAEESQPERSRAA